MEAQFCYNGCRMVCMSLKGFNHSVWNALLVLALPSVAIFLYLFLSLDGHHWFFDAKHNSDIGLQKEQGDFGPHSGRYSGLAKLLTTLSAGVIAFLVNTLANGKSSPSPIFIKVESTAPIVIGFFGSAMAILILFMALQAAWYEEYCHSPNHDTYTKWKYALCNTLGIVGLLAFAVGVIWFAQNLF